MRRTPLLLLPPKICPERSPHSRALLVLVCLVSIGSLCGPGAEADTFEPLRLSAPLLGTHAEIEVRGLGRDDADAAIRAALAEAYAIDRLVDENGDLPGGLASLTSKPGGGTLDPRLAQLLLGTLRYCFWSNGAHGPLGGAIYEQWAQAGPSSTPHPLDLRTAVESAECNHLAVAGDGDEPESLRFELAEGSRALAIASARGFAVDRAMGVLTEHGIENAWIQIGPVVRAVGPGPEGEGWLLALPPAPGERDPLDEVWLRDMAAAVLDDGPLYQDHVPLIDQRTGVPTQGVAMVVVATGAAFDAEVLAASLFATGMRDGLRRLGSLSPRPSVYWLLGEGVGAPLESTYRWSELPRLKRRSN